MNKNVNVPFQPGKAKVVRIKKNGDIEEITGFRDWLLSNLGLATVGTVFIVILIFFLNEMFGLLRFNKKTPLTHVRHKLQKDMP